MSIINDALKKAEKQKEESSTVSQPISTIPPKTANTSKYIMILCVFIGIVAASIPVIILKSQLFTIPKTIINRDKTSPSKKLSQLPPKVQAKPKEKVISRTKQKRDELKTPEQIKKLKTEEAAQLNSQGIIFFKKNNLLEAEKQFKKALEVNPKYAEAYNNLGLTFKKQKKLSKAMENYNSALKITPEYPECLNNLGVIYDQQGKLDKAIELFRKALEIRLNYPEAHLNLAVSLEKKGYIAEALLHYQRFIDLFSEQDPIFINKIKKHLKYITKTS